MRNRLSLRIKLITTTLSVVALALIGLNQLAVMEARQALIKTEMHVIKGVRASAQSQVETYFGVIHGQIDNFVNNLMVREATAEFSTAFQAVEPEAGGKTLSEHTQSVAGYFDQEFRPSLEEAGQSYAGASTYTPSRTQGKVLQDWYIASNPNGVGEKLNLDRAKPDHRYNELHAIYHPVVRQYLETFEYYDIFLFDTQGNMVYSVFKETDYATNFIDGPYKDSGLGEVVREALTLPEGGVTIRDFSPYLPSYGAAASFIAAPVFHDGERVGVAAFQMPVKRINGIVNGIAGLGEKGNAYLVGNDGVLRTNTRFDDSALLQRSLSADWLSSNTHDGIEVIGTGLDGNEAIIESATLDLEGLDWAIVIEADKAEIVAPAETLAWQILITALVLLSVVAVVLLFTIRTMTSPINQLIDRVRDMAEGEGDLTKRIDESRKDELGELGRWMNVFIEKIRSVIADSARVSQELAAASTQVAATAEEMARGMDDQRGQVTNVSAAIEEMSATVMEVARQTAEANQTAGQAGQQATEGGSVVEQTVESMSQIADVVNNASEAVGTLGARADEIGQVIDVINDIADQTNLLALNAAIEAARAGEHGRGFAVVADEVRKLAERTTTATEEVAQSIRAIQEEAEATVTRMSAGSERVNAGVACAQEAGKALQLIVTDAQNVAQLIQGITSSTEQQSQASDDIARSVEQITAVTSQSAEGATQMAQAADQLSCKSNELDGFDQYHMLLTTGPFRDDEFQEMCNAITINETSFFRNEGQLEVFENHLLSELIEKRKTTKRLRIWSAACSSGEEPYTLGIILSRTLGIRMMDWRIEILATDLSERVLDLAATGVYGPFSFRTVTDRVKQTNFTETPQGLQINDNIKELVHFEKHNLRDTLAAKRFGQFDAIFCRNVMIYFDDDMRASSQGMSLSDLDPGILQDFLTESDELLSSMDSLMVQLESAPEDADLLNTIFRALHTIKGASGFLGLSTVTEIAHASEDLLNKLRNAELQCNESIVTAILDSVDVLRGQLDQVGDGTAPDPAPKTLIDQIHTLASGEAEAAVTPASDVPPPTAETSSESADQARPETSSEAIPIEPIELDDSKASLLEFMVMDLGQTIDQLVELHRQCASPESRETACAEAEELADELVVLTAILVLMLIGVVYLGYQALQPQGFGDLGEEEVADQLEPRDPIISPRTDGEIAPGSGDVIAGGVERPGSDIALRDTPSEPDLDGEDPFGYGITAPVKADANEQVAAAYEALETGRYPERLSVAVASKTARSFDPQKFDPESDQYDEDYHKAYMRSPEPGRVWFPAQPAEGVSRIQPLMPRYVEVPQGQEITLRVSGVPGQPVTFTSFDLGQFENQLTTMTVVANNQGVAEANFQGPPGTIDDVAIMAASPVMSGQAQAVDDPPFLYTFTVVDAEVRLGFSELVTCHNRYWLKWTPCGCEDMSEDAVSDGSKGGAGYSSDSVSYASLIDNMSFSYHHYASDYKTERGSADCASCSVSSIDSGLMELKIDRHHRFRSMSEYGNFGPGVYTNFDTKIFLNEVSGGLQLDVFDPRELYSFRLVDGLNGDVLDGQFVDQRNNSLSGARLLDSNNALTTDLGQAVTVEVESHSGLVHRFEVIDLAGDTVDDDGLMGHWQFNEVSGSTALDSSTEGNDGTIIQALRVASSGAPIPGGAGGALLFDGVNDHVDLPGTGGIPYTGTLSIMAWIKTDTNTGIMNIVGQGHQSDPTGEIYLRVNNNNGRYQVGFHDGSINNAFYDIPAEDMANGGQWVHLAGVYDGRQLRLYRNGLLVAASQKLDLPDVGEDWTIGARDLGADRFFEGEIDDVRIYNRNVLEGDIAQIAQQRVLAGRLTQIEDRNGYSTDLTYKTFTQAEIDLSPERQWQIDTVTDPYSRTATYNYKSTQVAGHWVVESIDLPNGQDVDYLYEDDLHLTKAAHADGTESTFDYGTNATSQTTTVTFDDAAAENTSRRKTVYLTNVIVNPFNKMTAEIYSQSALLVRMVVNGAGEVGYFNMGKSTGNQNVVYEGAGKLRRMDSIRVMRNFKGGWTLGDPEDGFDAIQGSQESKFKFVPDANWDNEMAATGKIGKYVDHQGRTYELNYDTDSFPTSKSYSDATSESWAYNQFKQITTYTDRLGRQVVNEYDTNGNLTSRKEGIINGVNQAEFAEYTKAYYNGSEGPAYAGITGAAATQPVGLLKSETDANGNTTHFVYNDDNFLIATVAPADTVAGLPATAIGSQSNDRPITTYAYDTAGRLVTTTDPMGRATSFTYDVRGRQKTTVYFDGSTEELFYGNEAPGGAGQDANLVIAAKDRNDNYTQFRYDGHGRVVTTISGITNEADALEQSLIPDTTYHTVMECDYLAGTNLKTACVVNGERTEIAYDHRHRPVQTTRTVRSTTGTFPTPGIGNGDLVDTDGDGLTDDDDGVLTSRIVYSDDNLPFATIDPYGRASFMAYRSSDSAPIRTVTETIPGGSGIDPYSGTYAQVTSLTRDLSFEDATTLGANDVGGAEYLVSDLVLDAVAQPISIVDPRNIQYDTEFDSRGRTTARIEAVGTAIEARSELIYDANSNVIEARSPRYFDATDTQGFNKSRVTFTFTGRNQLATRTLAPGTTEAGTEAFTYYLDGTAQTRTDFNGNATGATPADHEWLTIWRQCCRRVRAAIDPAGHGRAQGTDFDGNVTHTAAVEDLASDLITAANGALTIANSDNGGPGIWDVPNDRTLFESTTRFDSKHRPVASTTWLETLGLTDPNDVPILFGGSIRGGANAQTAASGLGAGDGLTTLYYYSENIQETPVVSAGVEGVPVRGSSETESFLVHQFSGAPKIDLMPTLNKLSADGIDIFEGTSSLDAGTNASAVGVVNPEGEISVAILDGVGRTVITAELNPTNFEPVTWRTFNHDRVVNTPGYGWTLEVLSISALDNLNRARIDAAGRLVETIDAEGNASVAVYDNNGSRIRGRDANGVGNDCDFDARNRRILCTDTFGDSRGWAFNQNSQVLRSTDGKLVSNAADNVYDARGRLLSTTTRLSVSDTNSNTYDFNSNLLTQTDALGGVTTYTYDTRNLRIATEMPGHNPTAVVGDSDFDKYSYAYDALRRLEVKTDQQGDTVTHAYDLASRLDRRDYRLAVNSAIDQVTQLPGGTIEDTDSFTYDDASRLLTAVSGRYTNTVTKTYDLIGRTATEALTTNGQTYTVGYTSFDDDSRLTTLTYPDSTTVTRTYTARNQRQETRYQGALIADYTYDAGARETQRTLGNGLDTTFTYRSDNLLESIEVETSPGAGNRQALHFDYTYDANKNVLSETRAAGNTSNRAYRLSYSLAQDAKDRMTGWTRINTLTDLDAQTWSLNFENDWDSTTTTDAGTSTTAGRTHDAVHQLTEIDPTPASPGSGDELGQVYDDKGNLSNDGMGRALTHDFDNMLSQVTVSPGSSQGTPGTHTYAYDALGRRVSKTVNGTTTIFVCSGGQVLAEYTAGTAAASPERKYIYSVYIDEPIALVDRTAAGNVAAGTDEILYYHRNRQYSIIGLTNASTGTVVERYAYTAYGKPTITDGTGLNVRATSLYGNAYMHTGRRYDHESGLYYYRARYYAPVLGRFLERDPLGYPDGLNTYAAYHVIWQVGF
eukprot:g14114.t1